MREALPFSRLEELDTYPRCAEDVAFVWRVMQLASKLLKVFKPYVIPNVDYHQKRKGNYVFHFTLPC